MSMWRFSTGLRHLQTADHANVMHVSAKDSLSFVYVCTHRSENNEATNSLILNGNYMYTKMAVREKRVYLVVRTWQGFPCFEAIVLLYDIV